MLALLLALVVPAHAYDRDTHYFWTYYLALHVGFSDRQAYQIASGTQAIDEDPDTDPLTLAGWDGKVNDLPWYHYDHWPTTALLGPEGPGGNPEQGRVWRRFHCFVDITKQTIYERAIEQGNVISARELTGWVPPEDLGDLVDLEREAGAHLLWKMAVEDGNPGPYLHYRQDCVAHRDWNDVRGHAAVGHLPDWPAVRPIRAWGMTEDTVTALQDFMRQFLREAPEQPDMAHIRRGFDRLLAANPASDLGILDPGEHYMEQVFDNPTSFWNNTAGVYLATVTGEGRIDPGNPNIQAAAKVVQALVEEDRAAGRLPPPMPGFDFPYDRPIPPRHWMEFDFDSAGHVEPNPDDFDSGSTFRAHLEDDPGNAGAYRVESPSFEVLPDSGSTPRLTITPDRDSERLWRIDVAVHYELDGIAHLPMEFPVAYDCAWSDANFSSPPPPMSRSNGTWHIKSYAFRTYEAIRDGISWGCDIWVYGNEPVHVDVPVVWTGAPPEEEPLEEGVSSELSGILGEIRWTRDQAYGIGAQIRTACDDATATREAVESALKPHLRSLGPLQREVSALERIAGDLPGHPARAVLLQEQAYAAAEEAAESRSLAGEQALRTCEIAEQIRSTQDLSMLARLGEEIEATWDRADTASDASADARDRAMAAAKEADELKAETVGFDGELDATAATVQAMAPDLAGQQVALSAAMPMLDSARPLAPALADLDEAGAKSLGTAEELLGDRVPKSQANKRTVREIRSVYREISSLFRNGTACIDKESPKIERLAGKVETASQDATALSERLEVLAMQRPPPGVLDTLVVAAREASASAGAADLFPPAAADVVDQSRACLESGTGIVQERTSPDAQVAKYDCSMYPYAEARWDRRRDAPACFCVSGYLWNSAGTACEPAPPPGGDPSDPYRSGCQTQAALIGMLWVTGDPLSQQIAQQNADTAIADGCAPDLVTSGGMVTTTTPTRPQPQPPSGTGTGTGTGTGATGGSTTGSGTAFGEYTECHWNYVDGLLGQGDLTEPWCTCSDNHADGSFEVYAPEDDSVCGAQSNTWE